MKILYSILLFIISLSPIYGTDSFILDSLEESKKLSEQTDKPILLVFGAEYCGYCTQLKEDLLLSKDVDYIICYIDIKDNPEVRNQYNVGIVPDSRIIINSKEVSSFKGYSPKKYFKWLYNAK